MHEWRGQGDALKRAARKPPPYLVVFGRADEFIIFCDKYLTSVNVLYLVSLVFLSSRWLPVLASRLLSLPLPSFSSLCSAMRSFTTLLLALSLPLYALAAHSPLRRHNGLALRARGDLLPRQSYSNARCTFYDITTGQYVRPSVTNFPFLIHFTELLVVVIINLVTL